MGLVGVIMEMIENDNFGILLNNSPILPCDTDIIVLLLSIRIHDCFSELILKDTPNIWFY